MMNPRILVPTDFSELSLTAFDSAAYLARIMDGSVLPLHVHQTDKERVSFPVSPKTPKTPAEIAEDLDKIAERRVPENLLEPARVRRGKPWKIIAEESESADLIVMTSHGLTGFSRLLLGSVTERVVRSARVPVLLLEKESLIEPLEDILLTTDFSDYSLDAFNYARSLVLKTGAKIHLVHLISLQPFKDSSIFESQIAAIRERLDVWADDHLQDIRDLVTAEVLPVNASVNEAIVHLTRQKNYQMVVMSTLGHTGLKYLRIGSTAASVLRLVKTAVLSVNPKREEKAEIN